MIYPTLHVRGTNRLRVVIDFLRDGMNCRFQVLKSQKGDETDNEEYQDEL
jgi:hypothetical protein